MKKDLPLTKALTMLLGFGIREYQRDMVEAKSEFDKVIAVLFEAHSMVPPKGWSVEPDGDKFKIVWDE